MSHRCLEGQAPQLREPFLVGMKWHCFSISLSRESMVTGLLWVTGGDEGTPWPHCAEAAGSGVAPEKEEGP